MMRSSSSVLTPGRTHRSASLSAWATTRPASRIFMISRGDLSSITERSLCGRAHLFPAPHEALVVADQQLRLDLVDEVQGHSHHDEDSGSPQEGRHQELDLQDLVDHLGDESD